MFSLKMSSVIKISSYPGTMSYGMAISHLRCTFFFFMHHFYFMGKCIMKVMYYMAKVQKTSNLIRKCPFFSVSGQITFIT